MQQLEAQEGHFAESLISLQFQKAARAARALRAYTALLGLQHLLLEELRVSETLTQAACAQVLEAHSPVSARAWGLRREGGAVRSPAGSPRCPSGSAPASGRGAGPLTRLLSVPLGRSEGSVKSLSREHTALWKPEAALSLRLQKAASSWGHFSHL